ncbi:hypothetical protein ONS95_002346 [Cadophora gregata]|uniref:uncharacterized protein n=1 Tax=Cadophora gregata TaxID=51156 RepID=UPI0026DA9968|nr:uncharacterized protein ONS95_002346 [Cadophora gregata]KAK0109665.1 hypothetical protein ONS95_002346 [Cadophora gregata]KAK0110705.1 hypothetical protein ONS96_002304 [Cadophora gregata f. sp. sojae]
MDVDVDGDTESEYRIQVNDQVKYVVVQPGIYDLDDVLSFPPALLDSLPPFPPGHWTSLKVYLGTDGKPTYTTSSSPLKEETGRFGASVRLVERDGQELVAKIARFDFEIGYVENETRVYEKLEKDRIMNPELETIFPAFLGHLVENERPMGILLEKLEGRRAGIEDLPACEAVVRRLHSVGVIHGDVNRHNFLVDEQSGVVHLIDFENAKDYDAVKAEEEIASLKSQLVEDTGRGEKW